jgi:hypothetical protein
MNTRTPIPLRPDFAEAQRLERQSWHRVVTANALAALKRSDPADVLKSAWPTDQRAAVILRAGPNGRFAVKNGATLQRGGAAILAGAVHRFLPRIIFFRTPRFSA